MTTRSLYEYFETLTDKEIADMGWFRSQDSLKEGYFIYEFIAGPEENWASFRSPHSFGMSWSLVEKSLPEASLTWIPAPVKVQAALKEGVL